MKEIYLGRHGKAFGPYTEQEFQALKQSGEIKNFTWIWNADANHWNALDPAPPPIIIKPQSERAGAAPRLRKHDSPLPLDVICHDGLHAITGLIRNAIDQGCEFVAHSHVTEAPFAVPSRVVLSMLDPRAAKSLDIPVRLLSIGRKDGHWVLALAWENLPALVLNSMDSLAT